MKDLARIVRPAYWTLTIALSVVALAAAFFYAPDEATMGPVQKIFYIHMPAAVNMFLACTLVFVTSVGYIWQRRSWWDDLAAAAAEVAVLLCAVVLLTGVLWAKQAWGVWWTWSPRLTFSLVLLLLYIAYLMLRRSVDPGSRRSLICAVYAIVAFLDVPLVYLSVRLLPDIHPVNVQLAPQMKSTLFLGTIPCTMLAAGFIITRWRLNIRLRSEEDRDDIEVAPPIPPVPPLSTSRLSRMDKHP